MSLKEPQTAFCSSRQKERHGITRELNMTWFRPIERMSWVCFLTAVSVACAISHCPADSVIMKNGIVYPSLGAPDRDNNTLVYIYDGLKRIVVRDSKIEKIEANNQFRTGERFQFVQPMAVHAGSMPKEVISVQAAPWNERGRRFFKYLGSKSSKPVNMEQAIIDLTSHMAKYRGVDGFWLGQVRTDQVPRSVIMAMLARAEQKNRGERERIVQFLMELGWYREARKELDRMIHDFPEADLKERAANARAFITRAEAMQRRSDIDQRTRAQQPRRVGELLKTFKDKEIGAEIQVEVRDIERRAEREHAADLTLASDLRKISGKLATSVRGFWKEPLVEVLKALEEAPEAVRDRFAALRKAGVAGGASDEAQFALAMSGFVVGPEFATSELSSAETLWKARDLVHESIVSSDSAGRSGEIAKLENLPWPAAAAAGAPEMIARLELVTRMIQLMAPPRHDDTTVPEKTGLHRVSEDENPEPTEYAVRLPPEYHPLRSYPALVILHSGQGPGGAVDQWADEAARRGYILVAPEYTLPNQPPDYRYTPSEHAAVELALRDARKRYAIDSDRVFVAGQIIGGHMAWDYGLAHPDLFAGVIVISGLPAKYVPRYLSHHERLPLLVVLGDLAPASSEYVFDKLVKPMILKAWDVTYVEYLHRGQEEFPEEIPSAFEWMDRHRREPYPKAFEASSARTSDDRFYGVVIREFSEGRTTAPEAAEILGQNLHPATIKMKSSSLSNLIRLDVNGINRLDVWLSPKLIDFKRKPDIRINGKSFNRQSRVKLDLETLLEDVRMRGDRQQVYWYRVSAR
jgi:pimeloyl-ACP methyl ester carboxylesterase